MDEKKRIRLLLEFDVPPEAIEEAIKDFVEIAIRVSKEAYTVQGISSSVAEIKYLLQYDS